MKKIEMVFSGLQITDEKGNFVARISWADLGTAFYNSSERLSNQGFEACAEEADFFGNCIIESAQYQEWADSL